MPIIALQGLRGGSGATSLTAALAWALSSLNASVLAIDFCPINQLRLHFNTPREETRGWAQAIHQGGDWQGSALRYMPGLDFLPFGELSDDAVSAFEAQSDTALGPWPDRLRQLSSDYRWILLDVPAENSRWSRQASGLADLVLRVIVPDANTHLRLHQRPFSGNTRFVINQYNTHSRTHQDLQQLWLSIVSPLLPVMVHRDEALAEALLIKQPIGEYRPHSLAAEEVNTLANWLRVHASGSDA
ncbi:cellulose biosynthesis protein BcsQ [Pantoea sp. 1.19]|uniref:cellulose biosynthesis protein BcsQ n=1 Tax=Pantoea sp. 1.19 TaxID=1925589 RepID=UPI000948FF19|nr:cellulose biosynthesis protein BcsQ [Pantoea sp. 1.19]